MSSQLSSFNWVADSRAKILILGTMPGQKSLQEGHYYAHPRNGFWSIIEHILELPELEISKMAYRARYDILRQHGIALWDVFARCERKGSLDSAITLSTAQLNDFEALFKRSPEITHIYCNGGLAYRQFNKLVYHPNHLEQALIQLPSTSPAHAQMSISEKKRVWRQIAQHLTLAQSD